VRRFLADNVRPGMGRAIDLAPAFIVDPDVLIDFHRATPQGLVGAALASRAWRHRLVTVQRYIFDLECGRAGPATYNASGSHFVAKC
jgi:hypothetical protein